MKTYFGNPATIDITVFRPLALRRIFSNGLPFRLGFIFILLPLLLKVNTLYKFMTYETNQRGLNNY
jgi:hypothetical protein